MLPFALPPLTELFAFRKTAALTLEPTLETEVAGVAGPAEATGDPGGKVDAPATPTAGGSFDDDKDDSCRGGGDGDAERDDASDRIVSAPKKKRLFNGEAEDEIAPSPAAAAATVLVAAPASGIVSLNPLAAVLLPPLPQGFRPPPPEESPEARAGGDEVPLGAHVLFRGTPVRPGLDGDCPREGDREEDSGGVTVPTLLVLLVVLPRLLLELAGLSVEDKSLLFLLPSPGDRNLAFV